VVSTTRIVFAQSAMSWVVSTILIVSVRTVRNWEEITFPIAPVLYAENSGAITTRTVFAPGVRRVDNTPLGDHAALPSASEASKHYITIFFITIS